MSRVDNGTTKYVPVTRALFDVTNAATVAALIINALLCASLFNLLLDL